MTLEDMQTLISGLGESTRAIIKETEEKLRAEFNAVEKEDVELPIVDLDDIAQQAAALIPAPEKGEPGEKGEQGEKGEPGRDAMQQIDTASIERVIAKQVERMTPRIEFDGRRTLVITTPKAEGEPEVIKHTFKNFEWQGVWKESEQYHSGDVVTWAGSAWHCEEDNKGEKPGCTGCWQLCVKKGRDA